MSSLSQQLPVRTSQINRISIRNYSLTVIGGMVLGVMLLKLSLKVSLLLVLGPIAFLLIMCRPDIGFLLMVGTIPLAAVGTLLPPGYGITMSVAKIFGIFTLLSWLLQNVTTKKGGSTRSEPILPSQYVAIAGIWAVALVSVYFALGPGEAYMQQVYPRLNHLAGISMFYFLIVNFIDSPKFCKKIVIVLVSSVTLAALFAIFQRYFWASRLESEVTVGAVRDPTEASLGVVLRSAGFSHPDVLAVTLLIVVPLIWYLLRFAKTVAAKSFLGVILIAVLAALAFTGSRSGVVGLVVVFLLMSVKRLVRLSPALIGLLLVAALIGYLVVPGVLWQRVLSLGHYRESFNVEVRKDLLTTSLRMFRDHWLTGVGIGNFDRQLVFYSPRLSQMIREEETGTAGPHNMFAEVAAEMGILGLLFLLMFLWLTFADLRKAQRNFRTRGDLEMHMLATALEGSFIGFLLWSSAQGGLLLIKEWWLVCGLAFAMRKISVARSREMEVA